jgi:hypothetical protein
LPVNVSAVFVPSGAVVLSAVVVTLKLPDEKFSLLVARLVEAASAKYPSLLPELSNSILGVLMAAVWIKPLLPRNVPVVDLVKEKLPTV